MKLSLEIPITDHYEFAQYPDRAKKRALTLLREVFPVIAEAKSMRAGAALAGQRFGHLGKGYAPNTLLNLYLLYKNGGYKPGNRTAVYPPQDWRCLIPDRKETSQRCALPPEFVVFWQSIWREFTGRRDTIKQAAKRLYNEVWLAGKEVPGYGTAAQWYGAQGRPVPKPYTYEEADLPKGWSYKNLSRYLPRGKALRLRVQRGYLAAHTYEPDMVLTDRSALRPLERIYFDDWRPDQRVLWVNGRERKTVYPLCVAGIDGATGMVLKGTFKPELTTDEGAKLGITRDMLRVVVCQILEQFGLPPWPVTLVCENASAAISAADEAFLRGLFGDRIRIERTPMYRKKLSPNGYLEKGGSPFAKAPVEAFFAKAGRALAYLPGATGPRYDLSHDALKDKEKEMNEILALAKERNLSQGVFSALWTPFPMWEDWIRAANAMLEMYAHSHDHNLQGFDLIRQARMPDGQWLPYEQARFLLTEEQLNAAAIVQRRESPMERFARLTQGVQFSHASPEILRGYFLEKRRVLVKNGRITIVDTRLCSDPVIFREQGHPCLADREEGRAYDGVLEPDLSGIGLYREGAFMGRVARLHRIDVTDTLSIERRQHEVHAARSRDEAESLRPMYARADAEILAGRRRNAQLGIDTRLSSSKRARGVKRASKPLLEAPAGGRLPAAPAPLTLD